MRALALARWLRLAIAAGGWLRSLYTLILQSIQVVQFLRQVFFLRPATLPAVAPIEDEELEAKGVDLDGWLEADAQVVVVHLVELRARVQETDVAGDGKEKVIVERRQFGKLVFQHLGCGFGALTLLLDTVLNHLREDLVR